MCYERTVLSKESKMKAKQIVPLLVDFVLAFLFMPSFLMILNARPPVWKIAAASAAGSLVDAAINRFWRRYSLRTTFAASWANFLGLLAGGLCFYWYHLYHP